MSRPDDWLIYRGTGEPHDGINRLPPPPPWRQFYGEPTIQDPAASSTDQRLNARGQVYRASREQVELVNAALYLRRPLLVTGKPGTGKSSLAYSVARELRLGPVLHWPISSRSTLRDALYQYDAIARLQDLSLARGQPSPGIEDDIGRYLRLGPLGTALLPWHQPRVLLIDELDNSDLDLPGDLLNVLEYGEFEIPELARSGHAEHRVRSVDPMLAPVVVYGRVLCRAFPFVVITSNGEREFPPAFLRRCIELLMAPPSPSEVAEIVRAHLGEEASAGADQIIGRFLERREYGDLATDQLLNAIYLTVHVPHDSDDQSRLADFLLRGLHQEFS
jgi:MoxR-like ATPase